MRSLNLSSIQIADAASGDIWELYIDSTEQGETEYDLIIKAHARLLHDGSEGEPVNAFDEGAEPDIETGVGAIATVDDAGRQRIVPVENNDSAGTT